MRRTFIMSTLSTIPFIICRVISTAGSVLLLLVAPAAAVPVYTLTEIVGASDARGINDARQIVGSFQNADGEERAFVWDPNNGLTELGTLGGNNSSAMDINNAGEIVGYSSLATGGSTLAFVSDPNNDHALIALGAFVGNTNHSHANEANAINDTGQIVGLSFLTGGDITAFLSDPDNGHALTDLGNLDGYWSVAFGINNVGQVVGMSDDDAFISDPNDNHALIRLGTFNQIEFDGVWTRPWSVNDAGQVVGVGQKVLDWPDNPRIEELAFISDPENGHALIELGQLGGSRSSPWDINNDAQVVGWALNESGQRRAFFWQNGVMHDLNDLIDLSDPLFGSVVLTDARAINSYGDIAAVGIIDGRSQSFLLTAVRDEVAISAPSAITLFVIGLAGLHFVRRRKAAHARSVINNI